MEAGTFNFIASFWLHTMILEWLAAGLMLKFFDVDYLFRKGSDNCTRVIVSLISSRDKPARFLASDIVAHHHDTDGDFDLDLVAINVQRARDHGLRPYVNYLAHLQNRTTEKFCDLHQIMTKHSFEITRQLYRKVSDVDLYVRGYLEKQCHGVLSETIADIAAKQCGLFIKADRFSVNGGHFASVQLADILCSAIDLTNVSKFLLKEPFDSYIWHREQMLVH